MSCLATEQTQVHTETWFESLLFLKSFPYRFSFLASFQLPYLFWATRASVSLPQGWD